MSSVFDREHTAGIVKARLDHLAALDLPVEGRTVLEVGAGVGNLTGFFEKRAFCVVSTDGRPENVREARKRHPWREVHLADLENPRSHDALGPFEVVVCYGVLYHLGCPARCLRDLARVTLEVLVVETEVHGPDDWALEMVVEPTDKPDQAMHGAACRPGRGWVMGVLRECFPFAYLAREQPDHPWFPTRWPTDEHHARAVFVASRCELPCRGLTPDLLMEQKRVQAASDLP